MTDGAQAPTRADAAALDAADPLASFRDRFVIADDDLVYLDGNSLGRLPRDTVRRIREAVDDEWGHGLIESWDRWIDLPVEVGDLLGAHVLGAEPGQVVVADSTTVNLYKLAAAALDAGAGTGRDVVVAGAADFPTDRYVLEGLAAARGLDLRLVEFDTVAGPTVADVTPHLGERTALVALSHVDYRSGALADLGGITAIAHDAGALVLWDLSHSAGAVPIGLDAAGADLAVGCTYKYLNAGPGAPAFLYVRHALQRELRQPIWGWFGQRDQFGAAPNYEPQPDIRRFLTGTTPVLGVYAVQSGATLVAEAGIDRIRAKGGALGDLVVTLHDAWLAPLGFTLGTARDHARRGAHVAIRHRDAARISVALRDRARVVPDFRAPDVLRLGLAPLSTRFVDVWDALDRLRALAAAGEHLADGFSPGRVP